MPRPLCASFSPAFQSPRNLPSLGHLTVFRLAASIALARAGSSGLPATSAALHSRLVSSWTSRSTLAMPWSRNEALTISAAIWSSSAELGSAVEPGSEAQPATHGGERQAGDEVVAIDVHGVSPWLSA